MKLNWSPEENPDTIRQTKASIKTSKLIPNSNRTYHSYIFKLKISLRNVRFH